jgi:hypothetical protein
MTWKAAREELNWNYLGYLASNVRSVLLPIKRGDQFHLSPRDMQYLSKGKQFFDSAIAGCSSYEEPTRLFSIREQNVPTAATALKIAVDVYRSIHATPPASLEDLARRLKDYAATLDSVGQGLAVEKAREKPLNDLIRFIEALVQRASTERYRATKAARA